jgi:hypothetical protein
VTIWTRSVILGPAKSLGRRVASPIPWSGGARFRSTAGRLALDAEVRVELSVMLLTVGLCK